MGFHPAFDCKLINRSLNKFVQSVVSKTLLSEAFGVDSFRIRVAWRAVLPKFLAYVNNNLER